MNTVIKGRLTKNVEIETLSTGSKVATVRITENKAYIDRNGKKQKVTNWYNVKVWNGVAEALERTTAKGDLVKFKVNVQPNSYLSEKRQEVFNELVLTARAFKMVQRSRAAH